MLIEIHMLQNHAPSNLNRDDTGSPKECMFGGVKRARISSQCLKRSIRRSPVFKQELQGVALATRTRRLPDMVKELLIKQGLSTELADIAALKATGLGTKDGKEREDDGNTAQTMFITDTDVAAISKVLLDAAKAAGSAEKFKKVTAKEIQEKAELAGWRPVTIDVALFGRMITSPAFQDIEAAMQVAHAISTNKIEHEFDYFTAVDDLQAASEDDQSGADMIGDVEFNSACYYKYFSVDLAQLVDNLAGPSPDKATLAESQRLAALAIPAFVKAAIFTTPSGKQNTFAAHQLPDAVLVEVRNSPTPISYANAFVKPARPVGESDLIGASIELLASHVDQINHKFSLQTSNRLWFCTRESTLRSDSSVPVTACQTVDDLMGELKKIISGKGKPNA